MNGVSIFRPRTSRQRGAENFVQRIREIVTEYMVAGLKPAAAMAEIRAALREMDRNSPTQPGDERP